MLAAHNGLVKAKLFTDLDKLEVGDRFTLDVLNETFTYEVDQILVTLPEETEELYVQNGKDLVTLYTCTPYGGKIPTGSLSADTGNRPRMNGKNAPDSEKR